MSIKLTYTGAEVQELLDKIEKGDFDNAKTLEGHPASYFAIASEFTSLAESFATEQGRVNTLYSYFNNGSANDALSLGGQLPSYYATATQYEILQQALSDFKSLFDSMFEKDSEGNIHAKLSLWSSGGITAGDAGSGGSGGGISYNRLDSWADYSADKAGYVLSAALGKDLDSRVSSLANAGYVTASALAPYALRSEIPSLEGYATQAWVLSQQYLTSISKSMVTDALGVTLAYGRGRDSIPLIGAAGAMEVGYIIDFHRGDESENVDYSTRLRCEAAAGNTVLLPQGSGTLALISDIPSLAGYATQIWVGENYLPLSGGTLSGNVTAPTFTGVINSVAPTALSFSMSYTAGFYSCSASEEDGKIFIGSSVNNNVISSPNYDGIDTIQNIQSLRLAFHSSFFTEIATTPNSNHLWKRNVGAGTANPWERFVTEKAGVTWNISITGTADSATKLATPRTIWGHSFDGTQDITGVLTTTEDISFNTEKYNDVFWSRGFIWRNDNSEYGNLCYAKIGGVQYINIAHGAYNSILGLRILANGNVSIGGTTADEKLHVYGNGKFTGALLSQALRSAGISIGCDASGVASDNFAREINTFANKLYLQYRGGDLDLCGGGGTTYIGGALDGKTANFTSLTAPAITTNTLKVGNVTLVEENGALKVIGGFIATAGVTSGEKAS
jgi:hypothetical protein